MTSPHRLPEERDISTIPPALPLPDEPAWDWRSAVVEPDISQIVIEDDEPADNIYSEKIMRLLTEPLYSSWAGPRSADGQPRRWFASANVGVFATPELPPLVPDVLLSLDVAVHPDAPHDKKHNTYFVWVMGKPPDVVIEVVSNRKGHELSKRKAGYLRLRVARLVGLTE